MTNRHAPLLLAALALGCDRPAPRGVERLATAPVSGTVSLRGSPLAGATVTFQSATGTASATGETDAAGRFTLSTYAPADGAPPGRYVVVVSLDDFGVEPDGRIGPKNRPGPKPDLPAKFSRPSETPLAAEVAPAGPNAFRFDLK